MKTLMVITITMLSALAAMAAEKVQAGPKGGRLLEKTEPKAEFLVEQDRTATIRFYDAGLKPIAAGQQTANLIAVIKGARQIIAFEKKGDFLVSKSKLPEGDPYPVVLQFRPSADAAPRNFRFNLDLSICGGCKLGEYACTCHE